MFQGPVVLVRLFASLVVLEMAGQGSLKWSDMVPTTLQTGRWKAIGRTSRRSGTPDGSADQKSIQQARVGVKN